MPGVSEILSNSSVPQYESVVVVSTEFCDGFPDCDVNLEDELHPMCDDRFLCPNGNRISIAAEQLCDGTIDCDDGTDEALETCPERFICSSLAGTKVINIF